MIPPTRTAAEHDNWTVSFLSQLLLQSQLPWDHPEFIALADGFNIPLSTGGIRNYKLKDVDPHSLLTLAPS